MLSENAKTVENLLQDDHDELLKLLLDDPDALFMLKNISIQAHLYHGISPRLCEDQSIITMENLVKIQKYCLLQSMDSNQKEYYEVADRVSFLLNKNIPIEKIYQLTPEELTFAVEKRLGNSNSPK